ncbi:hypothetical protein PV08_11131 [Exophiala spinifera]|uniref:Uncharacterized protein n=1 Tax=Exophiala spinifera TaxID=91928 RepID=A0A0D2AUJ1_9EURO|nr:uncharacterized protein PV08_11131 [Exophiala spinifera]KIW10170.1 hypothetical protein PV08_11131 [Exophiala spinifera]
MLPNDERVDIQTSCPPLTYNYTERYNPRTGSFVFGYPSTGGVLIRGLGPVELVHLGLDRFKDATRSPDADEEDEFCTRLWRLGAQWWASRGEMEEALLRQDSGGAPQKKLAWTVETGWPSSGQGVWVLEYDVEDRAHYELRVGASLLNNCLDMDERCKVIENLGGTFYSNPDDCEALRPLSPEERTLG